jgi:uncharacterized protein (DUF2141 family)
MKTTALRLLTAAGCVLSAAGAAQAQAAASAASAPAATSACTPVEVHNVRPDQGSLMVRAFDAAADYNKAAVATMLVRADGEVVSFQLCGLRTGTVALSLFQDINGNGTLDRNAFGIPSEPWGASGKPSAFSAPTWETTQVPVDGKPVVVRLAK